MRPMLVATVPWTALRTRPDSGSAHRSARYSVCIHLQGWLPGWLALVSPSARVGGWPERADSSAGPEQTIDP
jgi:hypothetical protein